MICPYRVVRAMSLYAKWTRNSLKYIAKINLVRMREASVHIKWFIFSIHIYIIPSPLALRSLPDERRITIPAGAAHRDPSLRGVAPHSE